MAKKEEVNARKNGQRKYNCLITGCKEKGRIVGKLNTIKLTYCPRHRKKGERVLNFLINSLMRYKLTNFLRDSKQDLFMKNEPQLCDACYEKIRVYVNNKIIALNEIEKVMSIEDIDVNAPEEFVEEEENGN